MPSKKRVRDVRVNAVSTCRLALDSEKTSDHRGCCWKRENCVTEASATDVSRKKETVHLSFPPEGGRAAEAFWSLFSHTDGKIRDGYGEDGCGRKVVGTERLILTQHSPYL
ncbi:hypothetical protein MTP99_003897 [Tenebrio molitor]|nr:hypothetical protein MTP99_003897 [Tenebrio molitor]